LKEAMRDFGADAGLGAQFADAPRQAVGGDRHDARTGVGQAVGNVGAQTNSLARRFWLERVGGAQDEVRDLAGRDHDVGCHPVDELEEIFLQGRHVKATGHRLQAREREFSFCRAPDDAQG
jgi:hypothetical protein